MDKDDQRSLLPGLTIVGTNLGGIGCTVPILITLAILIGRELDRWLGTKPWILLLLLLCSIVAGLLVMTYSAFSAAQAAERQYRQPAGERDSHSGSRGEDEEQTV